MIRKFYILITLLLLGTFSALGQKPAKKHLSENDYDQWGTLSIKSVSPKGQWTSYEMAYDTGTDTLFLQSTSGKQSFSFPKGKQGTFGAEKLFGFLADGDLTIVSLKKINFRKIKDVKHFELLDDGTYLVTHHQDRSLQIWDSEGILIERIGAVDGFKTNPASDALVYSQEASGGHIAGCISFKAYNHLTLAKGSFRFDSFTWHEKGNLVVFSDGSGLVYYDMKDKRSITFDIASLSDYAGASILKNGLTGFRISNDGENVFFSVARALPAESKKDVEPVEVWNGNDKVLYPTQQELATRDTPKLAVWHTLTGSSKVLSDDSLYRARLTGNSNYVLLSNPFSYGLEPNYYEKVDYYMKHIKTGEEKLLLRKQSHDPNMVCAGPNNDLIAYYADKNWWLYDPADGTRRNLTMTITTAWDNDGNDAPNQFKAYGLAGWSSDGGSVLLYDEYDIWQFSLPDAAFSRLTSGRERKIAYRINRMEFEKYPSRSYDSGLVNLIDLDKKLLLECRGEDGFSGYAIYSKSKGVKMLAFENKHLAAIKRSSTGSFVFSSQTYSESPQVRFVKEGGSAKTLFKSNRQQSNYYYGRSELIHYENSRGTSHKGVLFYPADYDAGKQYPMIVQVYEKMSPQLHHYVNPTLLNAQGFSVTHYTLNGYFVLMPDISYELGNTGMSASDCITSAVKSVIASYPIDPASIGLIGHSFGGFETDFTITQSDLFAAAVSGAGLSDPIRHYFELNKNGSWGKDAMWKFERQQFRLGDSFFNSKENYWNNTSLTNAEKIKTPLLQWFGKNDKVIPGEQSIALYLALRRLGQPNILLIYSNEEHNLFLRENQIDLTKRITQWFDYYLKDKKEAKWIKDGILMK